MVGEKLRSLTQYLLLHKISAPKKFDSWMEQGRLHTGSEDLGDGYQLGTYRYQAIFSIEDYCHSPDRIMALVLIWMHENEQDRSDELGEPEIDVDDVDDTHGTADVMISISFEEPIQVVRDPAGDLSFNGDRFRIDTVEIGYASEVAVGDQTDTPDQWRETDAPYVEPV